MSADVRSPDCRAAEIHIPVAVTNRFNKCGTAEVVRVALSWAEKGHSRFRPTFSDDADVGQYRPYFLAGNLRLPVG